MNKYEKIGSIIVAYQPDHSILNNIKLISEQSTIVIVVDNTADGSSILIDLPDNVKLISLKKNLGIATALNIGVQEIINLGIDIAMTFDQDSTIGDNYINQMVSSFIETDSKERPVIIVAPQYRIQGVEFENGSGENKYIATAMTSGNLVVINRLISIGLFRDDYFIDYVDHEICLRARRYGFRIVASKYASLLHNLGNAEQKRLVFKLATVTHHTALRRFFMSRNRVRVYRNYIGFDKSWVLKDIWSIPLEVITILLFENNKLEKIQAMLRGFTVGFAEIYKNKSRGNN